MHCFLGSLPQGMRMLECLLLSALVAVMGAPIAHSQNSSLFQRPLAHLAQQQPRMDGGEVLPSPMPMQSPPSMQTYASPMNGPVAGPMGAMPGQGPGLGLPSVWSYLPPTPARELKLHDIVHIRVDEASTTLALGNATSRKTTLYDAAVRDWIRFVGIDTIKPAPQSNGDPRIQTTQNETYRGDSNLRTSETFTTNIAAEIVDIRPNGLIVLSANKSVVNDEDTFSYSLTGICRDKDIDASNTVLSRHLLDSKIVRTSEGHVRDGYSRGFLTKFVARIKPF
jgi:flagellar L-ring protein precursor FlgH